MRVWKNIYVCAIFRICIIYLNPFKFFRNEPIFFGKIKFCALYFQKIFMFTEFSWLQNMQFICILLYLFVFYLLKKIPSFNHSIVITCLLINKILSWTKKNVPLVKFDDATFRNYYHYYMILCLKLNKRNIKS